MSQRTYFYCRVSTSDQTTANQVQAFKSKGYEVNEDFVIAETVSGAVCAMERKGFRNMVENKLIKGDTLVVLKLDRLGRDNIDVQQTIDLLLEKGIKCVGMMVLRLQGMLSCKGIGKVISSIPPTRHPAS